MRGREAVSAGVGLLAIAAAIFAIGGGVRWATGDTGMFDRASVNVSQVRVWETDTAVATYRP